MDSNTACHSFRARLPVPTLERGVAGLHESGILSVPLFRLEPSGDGLQARGCKSRQVFAHRCGREHSTPLVYAGLSCSATGETQRWPICFVTMTEAVVCGIASSDRDGPGQPSFPPSRVDSGNVGRRHYCCPASFPHPGSPVCVFPSLEPRGTGLQSILACRQWTRACCCPSPGGGTSRRVSWPLSRHARPVWQPIRGQPEDARGGRCLRAGRGEASRTLEPSPAAVGALRRGVVAYIRWPSGMASRPNRCFNSKSSL